MIEWPRPRRLGALSAEDRDRPRGASSPGFALPAADGPALADERYRVHRAVRAALELLAAPKPLLLALDDVHWADSASLELLAGLAAPAAVGARRCSCSRRAPR